MRHLPGAVRVASLITGDADLAQDIAHDAFLRSVGRFRHLRQPEAFEAYLRRAVVNACTSHFRRRKVEAAYLRGLRLEARRRSTSRTTAVATSSGPRSRPCRRGSEPRSCSATTPTCPNTRRARPWDVPRPRFGRWSPARWRRFANASRGVRTRERSRTRPARRARRGCPARPDAHLGARGTPPFGPSSAGGVRGSGRALGDRDRRGSRGGSDDAAPGAKQPSGRRGADDDERDPQRDHDHVPADLAPDRPRHGRAERVPHDGRVTAPPDRARAGADGGARDLRVPRSGRGRCRSVADDRSGGATHARRPDEHRGRSSSGRCRSMRPSRPATRSGSSCAPDGSPRDGRSRLGSGCRRTPATTSATRCSRRSRR